MVNKKEFFQELNNCCWTLNDVFNINDGYCYYVAYLIAKFCEKNNIEYEFAAYREPHGNESTIYHYGIKIDKTIINPDWSGTQYYQIQYIKQDSKWMHEQHKKNYMPKLCHYWKDSYKRRVNSELKSLFGKYENF